MFLYSMYTESIQNVYRKSKYGIDKVSIYQGVARVLIILDFLPVP